MFRKVSFLFFCVALTSIPAMGQNNPPTTFTVPLASQAIINTLVGDGTTMTATCNTACGMAVGTTNFTVTNIFPTNCDGSGPNIIATASGNKVTWGSICIINAIGQAGNFTQVNAPVLVLANSGFSGNSVDLLLDYDSHLTEAMVANGAIKSDLDLDVSGIAALVNGVAPQAAYLDVKGFFCVGDLTPQEACGTTAWGNRAYGGALVKYQGLSAVSGNGNPFIVYGNNAVPLTGSVSPTTLFTTPELGYGSNNLYTMRLYAVATSGVANSTCQLNLLYTDVTGSQTQSSMPISFGSTGAKNAPAPFVFAPAPGTAIQISTTTTNAPQYKLWIEIEID
jgi:hypothetical protein